MQEEDKSLDMLKIVQFGLEIFMFSPVAYITVDFNPIRPGGGGLRGPDGQTHSCQSETSYPMMPKLGDFYL